MLKKLTILWIGCLVAISLQPMRPARGAALSLLHRPFHAAAFGLTALLLWRTRANWMGALAGTVLLGLGIEILQYVIYGCGMEWADVRDDTAAAAAAILLGCAVRAARRLQESL